MYDESDSARTYLFNNFSSASAILRAHDIIHKVLLLFARSVVEIHILSINAYDDSNSEHTYLFIYVGEMPT